MNRAASLIYTLRDRLHRLVRRIHNTHSDLLTDVSETGHTRFPHLASASRGEMKVRSAPVGSRPATFSAVEAIFRPLDVNRRSSGKVERGGRKQYTGCPLTCTGSLAL